MKVIKYGAPWCGQCKILERELSKGTLKCEHESINIEDLSSDELKELKIKNLPVTILLDDNSNEVKRWIGFISAEKINENL